MSRLDAGLATAFCLDVMRHAQRSEETDVLAPIEMNKPTEWK
jgi:hypothetical protein